MTKTIPCTILFMTALSACSGSNDPGVDAAAIESLATRAFSAAQADPLDLPSQATMSGFIAIEIESEIIPGPIIGDMEMTADFGALEVSGTASNLGEYEETGDCDLTSNCEFNLVQSLDGELVLANGTIFDDIYFDGELDGQLVGTYETDEQNDTYVADISMLVGGTFLMDSEGLLAVAAMEGEAIIETQVGDIFFAPTYDADGGFIVAD